MSFMTHLLHSPDYIWRRGSQEVKRHLNLNSYFYFQMPHACITLLLLNANEAVCVKMPMVTVRYT